MLNLKGAVDASIAHFLPLSKVALQPVRGPSVEPGIFFWMGFTKWLDRCR